MSSANLDLKLPALRAIREHSSVLGDFPGGPVVNTPPFNAEGKGLIPGQGIKVPHVTWYGQKIKINSVVLSHLVCVLVTAGLGV